MAQPSPGDIPVDSGLMLIKNDAQKPPGMHPYKPIATSLPVLLGFVGILASYMVLIELALHRSSKYDPSHQNQAPLTALTDTRLGNETMRPKVVPSKLPPEMPTIIKSSLPFAVKRNYVSTLCSICTGTVTDPQPDANAYLDSNSPIASSKVTVTTTSSESRSSLLVPGTFASAYLDIRPTESFEMTTGLTSPAGLDSESLLTLEIDSTPSATETPNAVADPSVYLDPEAGVTQETTSTAWMKHHGDQSTKSNSVSFYHPLSSTRSEARTLFLTATPTISAHNGSLVGMMPATSGSEPGVHPILETATPPIMAGDTATVEPWPIQPLSDVELVMNQRFTDSSYFAAIYLAPLLAVIAKACWEVIHSSFQMIEPFEKLAQSKGCSANHALFAQYLSCSLLFSTWKAACYGSIAAILRISLYAAVAVFSALAASSMRVQGMQNCPIVGGYVRCQPVWIINTTIMRVLEGLLGGSIMCLLLMLFITRAATGARVPANPSSICSMVALSNDKSLATDLLAIEPFGSITTFKSALQHRRVSLRHHEEIDGGRHYGIHADAVLFNEASEMKSNDQNSKVCGQKPSTRSKTLTTAVHKLLSQSRSTCTQSMFLDIAQITTSLAVMVMVLAYFYDQQSDGFNDFFNSNTWRPRLVSSLVAILLDMQWKRLEREVRITEPYRRLAKGCALPQTTILINLQGTCWSELLTTMFSFLHYRDMWFQTLITFVACLSELNIVAVALTPFNTGQTLYSVKVVAFIAVSITALMSAAMLITIAWWRRIPVIRKMPRCPDTIGAVLSYVCGSQMAKEFSRAHFETLSETKRNTTIIASGRRFKFGLTAGPDGIERWRVDFDDTWRTSACSHKDSTEISTDGSTEDLRLSIADGHV